MGATGWYGMVLQADPGTTQALEKVPYNQPSLHNFIPSLQTSPP
jgi:hypothetical protein